MAKTTQHLSQRSFNFLPGGPATTKLAMAFWKIAATASCRQLAITHATRPMHDDPTLASGFGNATPPTAQ